MRFGARRDRIADARRGILDAESGELDIATVSDLGFELASGLDVVAADALQRSPQQFGREVACSRSHRTGCQRSTDQPDRRLARRRHQKLTQVRPCRHGFDPNTAVVLRRRGMWDRLLVDCNIATFERDGLGVIENGAIGIADGKIVRVGKRTELAGYRAKQVDALSGAWVTPGLIDCHTHLLFGGNRADEHAMRRAGASYEEIAKAGGGIASTVKRTAAATDKELLEQSRLRLHALMRGGCTTVEVKTGYGLDAASEMRLLRIVSQLDQAELV